MANKWDRVRGSFDRAHSDLFEGSRYDAEFFNYSLSATDYDPNTGEINEGSRSSIGSIQVELVPPGMDTTVDVDGTSFSWDTSIRFPEDESIVGSLTTLGEDNERPTEVDISDPEESSDTTYELHGYSIEKGSGMVMARLVEQ